MKERERIAMTRNYVKDLKTQGQMVEEVFFVVEKQLLTTKAGKPYVRARLRDKTGEIEARWWDATRSAYEGIATEGFLLVKGTVEIYNEKAQVRIDAVRPMEAGQVDLADFMPACPRDVGEMLAELKALLDTLKEPQLKALLEACQGDEKLMDGFSRAPAGVRNHHAYLGGLLEHTLSMARIADLLCSHYEGLNRDLLLAGVFFHDIGKTVELAYDFAFSYTDPGQLIGHLIQGVSILEAKAAEVAAEGNAVHEEILDQLKHMILSHHGQYEYGSPKLPMTAEALVLHHVDNIDAKLNHVFRETAEGEERWTPWSRMMEGRIYRGPASPTAGQS
ncbi:MAG: HD domain-containing protein [Planctomycetia bacterium]|nr:HD domain-containing protein [Planctomycetia bacterium]